MYLPELSTTLSPGGSTLNVNYANRFTHLSLPRDFKLNEDPYPAMRHRGSTEQAAKALLNVSQYYTSASSAPQSAIETPESTPSDTKSEFDYLIKSDIPKFELKNKFHHNALLPPLPQIVSPGGIFLQNTTEALRPKSADDAAIQSSNMKHSSPTQNHNQDCHPDSIRDPNANPDANQTSTQNSNVEWVQYRGIT
jgi:hypothetical protein